MSEPINFELETGDPSIGRSRRVLSICLYGPRTFLWVGYDEDDDMRCFGTLSQAETKRLAETLLRIIGKRKKKKATT